MRRSLFFMGMAAVAALLVWGALHRRVGNREETQMTETSCGEANQLLFEARLKAVFGMLPQMLGPAFCSKTEYSSDMVAAVPIAGDTALPDWTFEALTPGQEVPIDFLFDMWPEVFSPAARNEAQIAIGRDPEGTANVTLVRLRRGDLYVMVSDAL